MFKVNSKPRHLHASLTKEVLRVTWRDKRFEGRRKPGFTRVNRGFTRVNFKLRLRSLELTQCVAYGDLSVLDTPFRSHYVYAGPLRRIATLCKVVVSQEKFAGILA